MATVGRLPVVAFFCARNTVLFVLLIESRQSILDSARAGQFQRYLLYLRAPLRKNCLSEYPLKQTTMIHPRIFWYLMSSYMSVDYCHSCHKSLNRGLNMQSQRLAPKLLRTYPSKKSILPSFNSISLHLLSTPHILFLCRPPWCTHSILSGSHRQFIVLLCSLFYTALIS
jgi:hypothetical protein